MEGCWGLGAFGMLTYPHFTDEETEAPRGKAPAIVTQLLRGGTGVPRTIFLTPESCPFVSLMSVRGVTSLWVTPVSGKAGSRMGQDAISPNLWCFLTKPGVTRQGAPG